MEYVLCVGGKKSLVHQFWMKMVEICNNDDDNKNN